MPESTKSEFFGIEPLEFLWLNSNRITDRVQQIPFKEPRRLIAEFCFRRITLMTFTFLRWNPLSSFFPANAYWDLPSSAAVARCIMETYLRMFYFAVEQVSEHKGRFRALLSDYHAQFQQLEIATYTGLSAEQLAPLKAWCDQARASLENNEYFRTLAEDWKKRLIEDPSRLKIPEISQRAGISPGYHHSSYEFCSSFIHGSLYAMQLTEKVNPNTGEGRRYFEHLADIVCGYVALAVRDFKDLFPELPALDPRLVLLGGFWSIAVARETIPGLDEIRRQQPADS